MNGEHFDWREDEMDLPIVDEAQLEKNCRVILEKSLNYYYNEGLLDAAAVLNECMQKFPDDPVQAIILVHGCFINGILDGRGVTGVEERKSETAYLQRTDFQFSGDADGAEGWHNIAVEFDRSHAIMVEIASDYLRDGGIVYDLGCGTGLASLPLLENFKGIKLRAMDGSSQMVNLMRKNTQHLTGADIYCGVVDLEDPDLLFNESYNPYFKDKADLIISNGCLQYLSDLGPIFEYVQGKLKQGGFFCFSLPMVENTNCELILESGEIVNRERFATTGNRSYICPEAALAKLFTLRGLSIVRRERRYVHTEPDMTAKTFYHYFVVRKV